MGEVQPNRKVYDASMQVVGVVEFNGRVLTQDAGVVAGVDAAGYLHTPAHQVIGQAQADQTVYTNSPAQQTSIYVGYVGQGVDDVRSSAARCCCWRSRGLAGNAGDQ